ncbi:hypothetical protein [Bradyrhizobium lablabi]|uniref:hypothetical protein n=1 Tax=Bradyrhizobium lablabi TaxID=722472 RepID=UPI001BA80F87|nr:hypothetical protein [Bradyrhizobium lablabi]MBR0697740.1 hypothetical protein [Bradyrhizobium lablabi]
MNIGLVDEPAERLRELQAGHAYEHELLLAIRGTWEDERDYRKRFACHRKRGAVFKYAGIKAFIADTLAANGGDPVVLMRDAA